MKFSTDLKDIKEFKRNTNENQIKMFKRIEIIETSEIWKKKIYYDTDELFKSFSKMSFKNFIRNAFDIGIIEYRNATNVLKLENGEELFARWGRQNMVTYLHADEPARIKVLEAAEQSKVTPNFCSLLAKIYPNKKIGKSIEIENVWKKKYEEVVIQLNELKEENKNLRLTFQTMMGVVKEDKKSNAV